MTNLDLYANAQHLLGIQEATKTLHHIYKLQLANYDTKTLLDVGCGDGDFIQQLTNDGIKCKGIDLSQTMVDKCVSKGLDVECIDIANENGKFDAIVAIFDVLNFMDKNSLFKFLNSISNRLNDNGVFIADINTLFGFSEVADGSMSVDAKNEFLSVDAEFSNNELHTKFTLFQKEGNLYNKFQDTIVQFFHKIKIFQNLDNLKLIDKKTFSLYDMDDKILLIFKKR
ncbi:MAG: class I SAM-dependent methyltransferase [Sulfurimonas sp.]|nr:class I SAM-dependent methyltransferase [Sulfurimonas sp.]